MSLHPILALDRVIHEYRVYLRTEFRAKDPALRAFPEESLDATGSLFRGRPVCDGPVRRVPPESNDFQDYFTPFRKVKKKGDPNGRRSESNRHEVAPGGF
jgi:hypothetical protein